MFLVLWFFAFEVLLAKCQLRRYAIALLDTVLCHPDAKELCSVDNKTIFLRSNVTPLLQFSHKGVLEIQITVKKASKELTLKFL